MANHTLDDAVLVYSPPSPCIQFLQAKMPKERSDVSEISSRPESGHASADDGLNASNTTAEARRQSALDGYRVVDSFAEQAFDDLTRLAAETLGTPIALISFLDHERNWFKSRIGMDAEQSLREFAICEHLLLKPGQVLVVKDAASDERFRTNPLVVNEPHIRFYVGAPLISPSGHVLGAICAIDTKPRDVEAEALDMLLFLAKQVVVQLEQRRRDLAQSESRLLPNAT